MVTSLILTQVNVYSPNTQIARCQQRPN